MKKFDVAVYGWVSRKIEAETRDEALDILLTELGEKYSLEWEDLSAEQLTDD